jgi:hypothetical protein
MRCSWRALRKLHSNGAVLLRAAVAPLASALVADFDAVLLDPARRYYDTLSEIEQQRIDDAIRAIREDPYVDMRTKFPFPYPPYNPVLFADAEFFLVYDFENDWTIAVWNIGRNDEMLLLPGAPEYR